LSAEYLSILNTFILTKFIVLKKIIHSTDFSENASKAFDFAVALSEKFDAELILLHIGELPTIMNSPSSAGTFSEMEQMDKDSIVKQLQQYAATKLKHTGNNNKIQFQARLSNSTIKGVVEAINETNADLVVIGSKGQSKLKEVIMGSTSRGLVSKSSCPVLIIPEKALYKEITQIVYATDFNRNDIATLKRLVSFAQLFNAKIDVLHIFNSDPVNNAEMTNFKQHLMEQVKYANLEYTTRVSDNVAETLAGYLQDTRTDLLVMFEKENSGIINQLFHKDMVKQFAIHTNIPLMSYNIISIESLQES
jgi:nucleotide-binding universal stress UspA family protein